MAANLRWGVSECDPPLAITPETATCVLAPARYDLALAAGRGGLAGPGDGRVGGGAPGGLELSNGGYSCQVSDEIGAKGMGLSLRFPPRVGSVRPGVPRGLGTVPRAVVGAWHPTGGGPRPSPLAVRPLAPRRRARSGRRTPDLCQKVGRLYRSTIRHLFAGAVQGIAGVRVVGRGGNFSPRYYPTPKRNRTGDRRRHYVREEVEAMGAVRGADVVLTHECGLSLYAGHPSKSSLGRPEIDWVCALVRLRLHLSGHHHAFSVQPGEGTWCVGLPALSAGYLTLVTGQGSTGAWRLMRWNGWGERMETWTLPAQGR